MHTMIHWFDIPATDFDRAVAFYQQVFHVELKEEHVMADRIAVFPDSSGCIMASPRLHPAANGTRIYLDGSPDVSTVLARAAQHGGQIVLPEMSLPDGHGQIGLFADSEGNIIGLHTEP
jgi:predicted enzyme related to lactoylglutathione lyase